MPDKLQKKVKFIGIEGMNFKPMETLMVEVKLYGMALIEHPDGYFDPSHNKNVIYVDVKDHIIVNY